MAPDAELGWLEDMSPRDVWPHEAHNFTPWLADNVDRLQDALGIEIEVEQTEAEIGSFSLDVLGRDLTNEVPLIVENQLERSDHSHLGQLMTYAAGVGAGTVVWVSPEIRDEHRQALQWLNEATGLDTHFFGVEVRVVRIGDSVPAPLFDVVVQPNDWQKAVRAASGTGRQSEYLRFWDAFQKRLQVERPDWRRDRVDRKAGHLVISVGFPKFTSGVAVFTGSGRIRHELWISGGDKQECREVFDRLVDQKVEIEAAYGRSLDWDVKDNRVACRIADYRSGSIDRVEEHGEYMEFFIDAGDRLRKALRSVGFLD